MASSERGARTTLMFGGVACEVSLTKTSGKPAEAKHETRRMIGDRLAEEVRREALAAWQEKHEVVATASGSGVAAPRHLPSDEPLGDPDVILDFTKGEVRGRAVEPFADLPAERVEQGVYLDDGSFVDLTDRLAEIDERTKIEGMEVLATIASSSVPRMRVRDSHWIGLASDPSKGKGQRGAKVLALLWRALRESDTAAVVRWTKRTNQALGIIVATGTREGTAARGRNAALCLLELEWSANMREASPRATLPISVSVSVREAAAALALAESIKAAPGTTLDGLVDERLSKRAELLTAAREGRLDAYEPPPKPAQAVVVEDVAEALTAAAAAR
jgi:non-homologous end joining protein Ku